MINDAIVNVMNLLQTTAFSYYGYLVILSKFQLFLVHFYSLKCIVYVSEYQLYSYSH